MQTKQKPQAKHIYTQRLIEICTDTKRQKHMQTKKCNNNSTYESSVCLWLKNNRMRKNFLLLEGTPPPSPSISFS